MPRLVPEFDYHADVEPHPVGPGPFGNRLEGTITAGEMSGERLKATVVGGGADWLLVGPDGFARLDVRTTVRTVDGAHVYVQYTGIWEMTPAVLALMDGGDTPTQFGEGYFITTPRLETGDERYAWVNQTVFVAEGRLVPGPRVEYRVYRVAPGDAAP
ncbi:Protein of unknown function [Geodermatophilus saharensis]|uniref:UPF0311 protein SAMN04488107_1750 n=1 Tax=Geodermatophilus saharensis TaxID=1137994 RepID=A0A239CQ64_9ACTN|nr:DUF3237 domain-containing protein [Geodermatophilus saharensis]SNS21992.1 Protein of unknown function [Geodermatophilus saharensis]